MAGPGLLDQCGRGLSEISGATQVFGILRRTPLRVLAHPDQLVRQSFHGLVIVQDHRLEQVLSVLELLVHEVIQWRKLSRDARAEDQAQQQADEQD